MFLITHTHTSLIQIFNFIRTSLYYHFLCKKRKTENNRKEKRRLNPNRKWNINNFWIILCFKQTAKIAQKLRKTFLFTWMYNPSSICFHPTKILQTQNNMPIYHISFSFVVLLFVREKRIKILMGKILKVYLCIYFACKLV